mmetsp:Transcript_8569/g.16205  ORF Transcript_8569/g.16205 Transcript_8569/m.16205 type:complete len:138 (+) Transcript_8569:121-534(+)|eukprot:CAMPEP_0172878004 /NCGR_PEP_ID=MMETSP1075-20121228/108456_1 /TAXON_ID=2916 /ORGANISM="Ceratium fusus, Strain PA161109" /LENGTH=137 /DNA_ID=CAMNT_0013729687 /DNA_START=56 /DNA_END=469 /DNA_ORIENTATION=-
MLGLARSLHSALTGSKKSANKQAGPGQPVDGVLLDGDGQVLHMDGHIMHVGTDGTLHMGDMDHLFGADPTLVASFPTETLESAAQLGDNAICAICQEKFVAMDVVKTLPCKHVFHADCVTQWLAVSRNCPLCEQAVG